MRRRNLFEMICSAWKRTVLFTIAFAGLGVIPVFGQEISSQPAGSWFAKPYELPKDVFDLPQFDRFRSNGRLSIEKAEAFLEALSDSNLPAAQRLFDIFAWRAFVALNWAAISDGQPDAGKAFNNTGPDTSLVWEFW